MHKIADNIYKYKIEMMGLAMLLIIFFHSRIGLTSIGLSWLTPIKNLGEIGVDLFLFIGGFTIAGSFYRSKSLIKFYSKRFWRIVPTYLLIWVPIYAAFTIRYRENIENFFYNLCFIGAISNDNLVLWYIPAILCYYIITPCYIYICQHNKYSMLLPLAVILISVQLMMTGVFIKLPFFMMWNRLPIYLLGINLYLINNHRNFTNSNIICIISTSSKELLINICVICMIILSLASAILLVQYHISNQPVELKRFLYIPVVIGSVYLYRYKNPLLYFVGTITLELYLLHEFIQGLIIDIISPSKTIMVISSLTLTFVLAYLIHKFMNKILKLIKSNSL